jgi:rhodanese-related sulfurtransferase
MKNVILGLAFALGLASQDVRKVTDAEELQQLLRDTRDRFLLDVREAREIEELGAIEGYVNIPVDQLEKRLSEVPKDKTIITA